MGTALTGMGAVLLAKLRNFTLVLEVQQVQEIVVCHSLLSS